MPTTRPQAPANSFPGLQMSRQSPVQTVPVPANAVSRGTAAAAPADRNAPGAGRAPHEQVYAIDRGLPPTRPGWNGRIRCRPGHCRQSVIPAGLRSRSRETLATGCDVRVRPGRRLHAARQARRGAVVDDRQAMAFGGEPINQRRADEPAAAGDKHVHSGTFRRCVQPRTWAAPPGTALAGRARSRRRLAPAGPRSVRHTHAASSFRSSHGLMARMYTRS